MRGNDTITNWIHKSINTVKRILTLWRYWIVLIEFLPSCCMYYLVSYTVTVHAVKNTTACGSTAGSHFRQELPDTQGIKPENAASMQMLTYWIFKYIFYRRYLLDEPLKIIWVVFWTSSQGMLATRRLQAEDTPKERLALQAMTVWQAGYSAPILGHTSNS